MERYKELPHTADLAARVYGKSKKGLFENACYAMFDLMTDLEALDKEGPEERITESIEIKDASGDPEVLLISLLNEVLYVSFKKNAVFYGFKINKLNASGVEITLQGIVLKEKRKILRHEIKAATYHDLRIVKIRSRYAVTIVFDV